VEQLGAWISVTSPARAGFPIGRGGCRPGVGGVRGPGREAGSFRRLACRPYQHPRTLPGFAETPVFASFGERPCGAMSLSIFHRLHMPPTRRQEKGCANGLRIDFSAGSLGGRCHHSLVIHIDWKRASSTTQWDSIRSHHRLILQHRSGNFEAHIYLHGCSRAIGFSFSMRRPLALNKFSLLPLWRRKP